MPMAFMPYGDFKGHIGIPSLKEGDFCIVVDDCINPSRISELRSSVIEGVFIYGPDVA